MGELIRGTNRELVSSSDPDQGPTNAPEEVPERPQDVGFPDSPGRPTEEIDGDRGKVIRQQGDEPRRTI